MGLEGKVDPRFSLPMFMGVATGGCKQCFSVAAEMDPVIHILIFVRRSCDDLHAQSLPIIDIRVQD